MTSNYPGTFLGFSVHNGYFLKHPRHVCPYKYIQLYESRGRTFPLTKKFYLMTLSQILPLPKAVNIF
jgi:hypothetical protein